MVLSIWVHSQMASSTAKASIGGHKMALTTKVNGIGTLLKAMELTNGKTVECIQDIGQKIRCMVLGGIIGLKENSMKVSL